MNQNLIQRVVSAVVALPLLGLLIWVGGTWMYALLLVIGSVCFYEYGGIVASGDSFARGLLVVLGSITVAAGMRVEDPAIAMLVVQGGALFTAILYTLRPRDIESVWPRMSALFFGVVYVGLAHIALYRLRMLGEELPARTSPLVWIWLPLIATWANDTFAYFAGRAFGRTKLYPIVSPKKTWEGALGGGVGSVAVPFGFYFAFQPWLLDVSPIDILCVALPAAVLAPLGDLVESLLKRSYGTKDSGGILPGHGGFLDRVDAVYFVAPWTLFYVLALRPLLL